MKSSGTHLIIALVVGSILLMGYVAEYATISQKSATVVSLGEQITAATRSVARTESVRTALAEIKGDEATIQSYFVSEADIVSFITALEALGAAQKTEVSVLSVSASTREGQPILKLALSVKGTFDAVMRTVGAIEYAPYDIEISTLTVTHDITDKEAGSRWGADISLVAGSLPAPAATSTTQ